MTRVTRSPSYERCPIHIKNKSVSDPTGKKVKVFVEGISVLCDDDGNWDDITDSNVIDMSDRNEDDDADSSYEEASNKYTAEDGAPMNQSNNEIQ